MIRKVQLVLVLGLLLSCTGEEERPMDNPTQIDIYFPLKEFVENQIKKLDGAKAQKFTHIVGEEESLVREFNAEEWRKELDIFIQADINKSALASSYETEKGSNFLIHRLKSGEKSSIREIKVVYEDQQVIQIRFVSHQENMFYTSGSVGEIRLNSNSDMIQSYHVKGTQKVWFLSPNEMEVKGEILQ